MSNKSELVGWMGLGLIIANLIDGSLRPLFSLISTNGNTYASSGSSEPLWEKALGGLGDLTSPGSVIPKIVGGLATGGGSSKVPAGTPKTGSSHPRTGRPPEVAPPVSTSTSGLYA